ncbi:MAG: short-chain dehydrogenase/reductase [Acidimicrobiales bacterium]|nr:short-chain dehydrogenase/reductase [Acidimicrobiales bacterium]
MRDALGGVQSVLVLGGGSEIARATVRKLVADRCRTVILAGRRPAALEPVAAELRDAGATTVEVVAFDAQDTTSHATVLGDVFDRHPDLDVVLLAFGVLGSQPEFEADPSAAAAAVQANYVGAVSSGLVVADRLRRQGHGQLVVLSSVAGERARRDNFVYGSSKAGLDAFAQGLADSLTGSGVSVVIVRPGFVRTQMTEGMTDAPFATTADAVADDIVAGIRRDAPVVWSPAKLRWVFVVLRHLPRPIWRKVANR